MKYFFFITVFDPRNENKLNLLLVIEINLEWEFEPHPQTVNQHSHIAAVFLAVMHDWNSML